MKEANDVVTVIKLRDEYWQLKQALSKPYNVTKGRTIFTRSRNRRVKVLRDNKEIRAVNSPNQIYLSQPEITERNKSIEKEKCVEFIKVFLNKETKQEK